MKDVLEAIPFVSMQPHEQVQRYRVRSLSQHNRGVYRCYTSALPPWLNSTSRDCARHGILRFMVHAQDMVAKLRGFFMQGGDREDSPEHQQILATISESVRDF